MHFEWKGAYVKRFQLISGTNEITSLCKQEPFLCTIFFSSYSREYIVGVVSNKQTDRR